MINEVLDFSKIEAGQLELEAVEFDLRVMIEEIVERFSRQAAAKGLNLACFLDPRTTQRWSAIRYVCSRFWPT